ncbi:MAG: hypothetical protein Ct9H300mP23_05330 [Nitrospinota bacterium]|nr:MAG: hypothetical protein Ct9H300mP23_05330 [Nitrospinota bacterium]
MGFKCRKKLISNLKDSGVLIKIEDLNHSVGHCSRVSDRSGTLFSKQGFVKVKPLAEPEKESGAGRKIKIFPQILGEYLFRMDGKYS